MTNDNDKIQTFINLMMGHEGMGSDLMDRLRLNEPMSSRSTFKVGGPADLFFDVRSEEELIAALSHASDLNIPVTVLGNGSNILVSDRGIRGLVVSVGSYMTSVTVDDIYLEAQAGALMSSVSKASAKAGLTGMEFASGIPGTIGGAVYMNAGAYDGTIAGIIHKTRGLDVKTLNLFELEGEEAHLFGYRKSFYSLNNAVILSATFKLVYGDEGEIREKLKDLSMRRAKSQPLELPSAGSTFKRPPGYYAGKLIEDAGLKGYRIGGACVSQKHAGFIVNDEGAKASDIYELICHVRQTVLEKNGVLLEPEVRILGDW